MTSIKLIISFNIHKNSHRNWSTKRLNSLHLITQLIMVELGSNPGSLSQRALQTPFTMHTFLSQLQLCLQGWDCASHPSANTTLEHLLSASWDCFVPQNYCFKISTFISLSIVLWFFQIKNLYHFLMWSLITIFSFLRNVWKYQIPPLLKCFQIFKSLPRGSRVKSLLTAYYMVKYIILF